MSAERQFRIRRALLRTVYDYSCGQDLESVLCSPELLLENPSPEAAFREWISLIDAGILVPLPGYERRVCKLAPGVREKMDARNGALPHDPILFGPKVM